MTLAEFNDGFWDGNSEYVRYYKSRKDVTDTYMKKLAKNQIIPFFGKLPLNEITQEDVDKWLLGFKDRGIVDEETEEIKQYYKNSYANGAFRTFNIIMAEALRWGLVRTNPCANVKGLIKKHKDIEIFTLDEVRKIFPKDYTTVWGKT
jgi:integrase